MQVVCSRTYHRCREASTHQHMPSQAALASPWPFPSRALFVTFQLPITMPHHPPTTAACFLPTKIKDGSLLRATCHIPRTFFSLFYLGFFLHVMLTPRAIFHGLREHTTIASSKSQRGRHISQFLDMNWSFLCSPDPDCKDWPISGQFTSEPLSRVGVFPGKPSSGRPLARFSDARTTLGKRRNV